MCWGKAMKRFSNLANWTLLPRTNARTLPDYIPENVQKSYYQACLIAKISPDAASIMARYCLQQMVRDFWSLPRAKMGTLDTELRIVSRKMPPETVESIKIVVEFGAIEASLVEDVRILMPTQPEEAEMMIKLIELLFDEWYTDRHTRQGRTAALRKAAQDCEKRVTTTLSAVDPMPMGPDLQHIKQIESKPAPRKPRAAKSNRAKRA